jgi:hypothetical protein
MKSVGVFIFALFCSLSVFAEGHETKTFLVLFQSKELKSMKVSVKDIESQFSSVFKTKSYQGNSVPSILIEVPNCDFDACFLGDLLIELGKDDQIKLEDLAFRLFDITERKKSHESELMTFDNQNKKSFKSDKTVKASLRL